MIREDEAKKEQEMQKVQPFSEINDEAMPLAGGKGSVLATMYQRGYPVPDGFVVLTSAFDETGLLPEAWKQVKENISRLKEEDIFPRNMGGVYYK